jgi:hypothetical protein
MRPGSENAFAFSHVSFDNLRVEGPREQIFMDLRVLSLRNARNTSANIDPVKGEYR